MINRISTAVDVPMRLTMEIPVHSGELHTAPCQLAVPDEPASAAATAESLERVQFKDEASELCAVATFVIVGRHCVLIGFECNGVPGHSIQDK